MIFLEAQVVNLVQLVIIALKEQHPVMQIYVNLDFIVQQEQPVLIAINV